VCRGEGGDQKKSPSRVREAWCQTEGVGGQQNPSVSCSREGGVVGFKWRVMVAKKTPSVLHSSNVGVCVVSNRGVVDLW